MLATVTDWLWSYVLIAALLLVGLRLSWDARFVQLRLFKEMFRGLSGGFSGTDKGLSSFQALVVSVAGRVGGGNIAGVAVAITLGGLLIALFVGWFMKRELSFSELATGEQVFSIWHLLLRFVVVPAIAIILITGLI